MTKLRVGLLVNPVAGLGGPGAYKGSDGNWKDALAEGYQPTALPRAKQFVKLVGDAVSWVAAPGVMGGEAVPGAQIVLPDSNYAFGETGPDATIAVAQALQKAGIDLLCFFGGDGTATDVAKAVGTSQVCLGVPAGVKITSAVYTHDVAEAAWLVTHLQKGFETLLRDVTDLDEEAYRTGHVEVELKGSLRVPLSPAIQSGKVATTTETPLEPLVEQVLRDWNPASLTFIGAGSVCEAVKRQFWGKPTLLGVDAIQGTRIIATDLDDRTILEMAKAHWATGGVVRIVLSTIGGQGMLLGRGTQMFTPALLRQVGWEKIVVVAPPEKLLGLKGLHIDTGDTQLDASAPKHIRVITGWNETRMIRVLAGARNPPENGDKEEVKTA